MIKTRVGILFGGKSVEHEVSVRSARSIYDALDKEIFDPILIGVTHSGKWVLADADKLASGRADATNRCVDPDEGPEVMLRSGSRGRLTVVGSNKNIAVDVIFPMLHGPFGEDGTIQGLLKIADVPFVGPSILGSAVGMDKDVTKRLLMQAGVEVAPYRVVRMNSVVDTRRLINELGLPLFIKPANLGSSIGISKVSTPEELLAAVEEALKYDAKVLIESAIIGRECECAVLGNGEPKASTVGEVVPIGDFYSYRSKYLDENGATVQIPARLPDDMLEQIRSVAVKSAIVLECEGMVRVDVFVTKNNKIVVNEVNTIPGFTSISMYPKLWEHSGIPYRHLLTRLIDLAKERHQRDSKLLRTISKDV